MRPYPLFSVSSLLVRILFAFLFVFGLYNPSGRSYVDWLMHGDEIGILWRVTVGVALLAILRIVVVVAWRALGIYGSASYAIVAIFTCSAGASMFELNSWLIQTTLLTVVAFYLGIGLSWSGILYRISRQVQSVSIAQAQSAL